MHRSDSIKLATIFDFVKSNIEISLSDSFEHNCKREVELDTGKDSAILIFFTLGGIKNTPQKSVR